MVKSDNQLGTQSLLKIENMNKKFYMGLFALVCGGMMFTSCGDDAEEVINGGDVVEQGEPLTEIMASCKVATKTTLGGEVTPGNYSVNWKIGDQITVLSPQNVAGQTEKATFNLIEGGGSISAKFFGKLYKAPSGNWGGNYIAVYPKQSSVGISTNATTIVNVVLPNIQYAVKGGFDPNANIMTAVFGKDDEEVTFYHSCAYIKLEVPTCKSIKVTGTERLSGSANILANHSVNSITSTATSNGVTLLPAKGKAEIENGVYYIAFYPRYDQWLTFTVDLDGSRSLKRTTPKITATTIKVGQIIDFGTASESEGWTAE